MAESVKVAVRVRPFNQREKDRNSKLVIEMPEDIPGKCIITDPSNGKKHEFMFDYAYWSHDHSRSFCSQDVVYNDMGKEILQKAFLGFNITLFAYGQTGSGKSYSMMGAGDINGDQAGIIPRVCQEIFAKINEEKDNTEGITYKVEASFLEIYNEKIRDLLNPAQDPKKSLQVRESKEKGIFVDGLIKRPVSSYDDINRVLDSGNQARTVGATAMNAVSSRSHSVFTIIFTQTKIRKETMTASDTVSKINLVDLAGSERAESTGATGDRLKEGCAINKSLSALGNVISALAKNADPSNKKKELVPYRNSVLTRLLQESLGGNSITTMIAALSPADINYDETLSTLRYADRAKQIKNVARRNESPNERIIRELKEEVERLRAALEGRGIDVNSIGSGGGAGDGSNSKLSELAEKQLREKIQKEWQDKMEKALEEERKKADELRKAGIMNAGDKDDMVEPYLINLNEDPMLSETLIYELKGEKFIGSGEDSKMKCDIKLTGVDIMPFHCRIENEGEIKVTAPSVSNPPRHKIVLYSGPGASICYNGDQISGEGTKKSNEKTQVDLKHGDRLLLGQSMWFRVVDPTTSKFLVEDSKKRGLTYKAPVLDYDYATRELSRKRLGLEGDTAMDEAQERIINERIKKIEEEYKKKMDATGTVDLKQKEELKKLQKEKEKQERDRRNKRLFEATVSDLLEPISRANFYSDKLGKNIRYSLDFSANIGGSGELTSVVNVKSLDELSGRSTLFSPEEFKAKYYIMEELCTELLTFSPEELERYNNGEKVNGLVYNYKEDPFLDLRENSSKLIGNATFLLEPLYYCFAGEMRLSLISAGGSDGGGVKKQGEISISYSPLVIDKKGNIQPDPDFDEADFDEGDLLQIGYRSGIKITVNQVFGLPNDYKRNCYCTFTFFNEGAPRKSPVCACDSINPEINWTELCIVDVTSTEFVDYIKEGSLVFSVYASSSTNTAESINLRLSKQKSNTASPLTSLPSSPKSVTSNDESKTFSEASSRKSKTEVKSESKSPKSGKADKEESVKSPKSKSSHSHTSSKDKEKVKDSSKEKDKSKEKEKEKDKDKEKDKEKDKKKSSKDKDKDDKKHSSKSKDKKDDKKHSHKKDDDEKDKKKKKK